MGITSTNRHSPLTTNRQSHKSFYLSFLVLVILVFIYLPFCSVWFLRNCKRTVITPKLFPLFNFYYYYYYFCVLFLISLLLCSIWYLRKSKRTENWNFNIYIKIWFTKSYLSFISSSLSLWWLKKLWGTRWRTQINFGFFFFKL